MADIVVSRGTNDVGNTGGTQAVSVSSLTAAFEYNSNSMFTHGGSTSSGGNMEGDDMSGSVELTATDTLTFTRQPGSLAQNMRHDWQLLEYTGAASGANEFIVRSRNTITMSGTSTTQALDTTPTNIDKCVPFITGVRTSQTNNEADELRVCAHINDSGLLVVEKGSTTTTTVVQVVVVEFTGSAWEVYHGTATSSGDTGTITLNTDSDGAGGSTGDVSDWSTAFIEGSFTTTDHGLDSIACRYDEGAGTTTVDWDLNSGNSSSHKHFVHVVKHADMSVTRYVLGGAAATAGDTNVDITSAGLTDLSAAFIIGTCQGSGGGTAYGRNWRNYRITSLTNAQHYCHRSGNTISHNIQVIDFVNVEDAGGGTEYNDSVTEGGQYSNTNTATLVLNSTRTELFSFSDSTSSTAQYLRGLQEGGVLESTQSALITSNKSLISTQVLQVSFEASQATSRALTESLSIGFSTEGEVLQGGDLVEGSVSLSAEFGDTLGGDLQASKGLSEALTVGLIATVQLIAQGGHPSGVVLQGNHEATTEASRSLLEPQVFGFSTEAEQLAPGDAVLTESTAVNAAFEAQHIQVNKPGGVATHYKRLMADEDDVIQMIIELDRTIRGNR